MPLSIATPERRIHQGPKHTFRNFLIDEAKSLTNILPTNARWLIDGMAALPSVKPKETYKQWLSRSLSFIRSSKESNPLSVELVNDRYSANSIKNSTCEKGGQQQQRTYIQGFQQKIPEGNAWLVFFNCIENKTDLIKLATSYLKDIGTTSFFYGIGKVNVSKKLQTDSSLLTLLREIGRSEWLSYGGLIDASRLIQTVLYKGRPKESLVEMLIQLYRALKTNSLKALPPDTDLLTQAILRVHLQSYYWLKFRQQNIKDINIEQNGWYVQ